jgi:hypothetical protein
MKTFILLLALLPLIPVLAQQIGPYTTAQAHSHNDYERRRPFDEAYEQQFGSVEADIFLMRDSLFVAHSAGQIKSSRTLRKLYLLPILEKTERNKGNVYPQEDLPLQLLIDLKTDGETTLAALVRELEPFTEILAPRGTVKIVVSGNTPDPSQFARYPGFIYFDGRPDISYTPEQMERVALISQAFQKYSGWNGEGPLPERDKKRLAKAIREVHDRGKKMRLWATPDNINAWKAMMAAGVDFLNTDKVREMGDYLRTAPR